MLIEELCVFVVLATYNRMRSRGRLARMFLRLSYAQPAGTYVSNQYERVYAFRPFSGR